MDPNFPRMLHKPDGSHVICATQEDVDEKRAEGWQLHAVPRAHEHEWATPDELEALELELDAAGDVSDGPSDDDGDDRARVEPVAATHKKRHRGRH